MEDKKVYAVEWGFLLSKDSVEYEKYSSVYGGKNAYYDENQYYTTDNLEGIIINLLDCVAKGVNNIYVIVSYQCMLSDFNASEIKDDEELNNDYFDTSDIDYSEESIVFSAYKNENREIILDFTKKEMK